MKIISFLGFNPKGYKETTYISPNRQHKFTTSLFQEALVEFYKPEEMYVLLTKTAEKSIPENATQSTWENLKNRLHNKVDLKPIVDIPEGHETEDFWNLFSKLTACLDDTDEVLFDITHGFRSLPVIALIAVSFLRVVRNIKLKGLVYGAFDAKNKETNETPTFDLIPVVILFDWLTATDQFLKTGKGEDLAKLLKNAEGHTEALGNRILEISQGLELLRPMDVMKAASALPENIELAKPDLANVVPPFEMLLNRVVDEYSQFTLAEPQNYQENGKLALEKQLFEIEWYARKGLEVQAISLAREWLPSLLCYHFNLDPMDKQAREEMEILCCGGKIGERESVYRNQYKKIQESKRKLINQLWNDPPCTLANLRNDVLHSGFRKNPKSITEIKEVLQKIINQLNEIAVVWEILEP